MKAETQIKTLLKVLSQGIFEKEHILSMALLSAIAGESIFLLGPPGTAKSLGSCNRLVEENPNMGSIA